MRYSQIKVHEQVLSCNDSLKCRVLRIDNYQAPKMHFSKELCTFQEEVSGDHCHRIFNHVWSKVKLLILVLADDVFDIIIVRQISTMKVSCKLLPWKNIILIHLGKGIKFIHNWVSSCLNIRLPLLSWSRCLMNPVVAFFLGLRLFDWLISKLFLFNICISLTTIDSLWTT